MSVTDAPRHGSVRCEHCLQEMPERSSISKKIDGQRHFFCCHGCLGVWEIVHGGSLDTFYNERCDWTPGRPAFTAVNPADFASLIVTDGKTSRLDLSLSGIRCASCVWLVEKVLSRLDGVLSARVNYATRRATFEWRPETISLEKILSTLSNMGYAPLPGNRTASIDAAAAEKREMLLRFGTAGFFSMQLMLITAALYAGFFQGMETHYRTAFQLISWVLSTPVIFYSGFPFLAGAFRSLRSGGANMDVLVSLGALSAYGYSVAMIFTGGELFFDTSAMIVTFILLGRFIEAGSRLKAGSALTALVELQPSEARISEANGETTFVPLDKISKGSLIEVIPGDRVPLDGTVAEGSADVDESMLTGESVPVLKSRGSEVYAGTASLTGRLLIRVTAEPHETVLARIVRTVEEAQARKAPIQGIADRTAAFFVPAIVLLATGTLLWWSLVKGAPVAALMNAVSVLVVACPCALGLATPLAILVGTTAIGRKGILVKGGDLFESVSRTSTVVFDKTGTLTKGRPSITDTLDYQVSDRFMQHCASLEAWSEHPAGKAIVAAWHGERLRVKEFRAIPGMGVAGFIDGRQWIAGTPALLQQEGVKPEPEQLQQVEALRNEGKTVILIACEKRLAGLIALIDTLREEATEMIASLHALGLKNIMLTGDHEVVARTVASHCGITDVRAGLNPLGKADAVRELKQSGATVMMAGDGINDAPALTEADTGLTLGSATGIALESSGIAILNDDLRLITTLFTHARKSFRIIRQNLFWAFGYNMLALPLAISGILHPIVSAILMATSSLVVVGNSLRLRNL
ncbi:MAG: heavy metal translocating P-type ATPase [Chlorobiaceae bacterium]|nr:heavy metal translocating P-type ATPase [Chlorobiaceae bacterium]